MRLSSYPKQPPHTTTGGGILCRIKRRRAALWGMPLLAFFAVATVSTHLRIYRPLTASTTWMVTSTDDTDNGSCGATCTLRDAIKYSAAGDSVAFDSTVFASAGGPYTITLGSELGIDHDLTITGPGADVLTISGDNSQRVFHITTSTVVISGVTVANGNSGGNSGGGIENDQGTLTVSACAFSSNAGEVGGGIFNNGNGGSAILTVSSCTFAGNSSGVNGGGIYNNGFSGSATLTVTNSTFSGNSAQYNGGAIYNDPAATATLTNCTLSGNTAGNDGGGISNGGTSVSLLNTILDGSSLNGSVTSLGHNISSDDDSARLNQASDRNSTDPLLDPLTDNGGPTQTMALAPGSPALDSGDDSVSTANGGTLDFDQRGDGFPRQFQHVDIGAYEDQTNAAPVAVSQSLFINSNVHKIITLSGTDADGDTLTFKIDSLPTHGDLYEGAGTSGHQFTAGDTFPYALTGNQITYVPTAAYLGADSFTFTANDLLLDSTNPGTVSITVTEPGSLIVTTSADSTPGTATDSDSKNSLREAIHYAEDNAGADEITFAIPTGEQVGGIWLIKLNAALPSISEDTTVTGPGASSLSVDGQKKYQILRIGSGDVTLSGLTFIQGRALLGEGGAIKHTLGSLTINDCVFRGNWAQDGGAIFSADGTLDITGSSFVDNATVNGGCGGAISTQSPSTVANSTFTSNTSDCDGGAIDNDGNTLTVTGSTFTDNLALSGGAIGNYGILTVTTSTFDSNRAYFPGGAIYTTQTAGECTVEDSAFTGNFGLVGGAIAHEDGALTVSGSSFTDNAATGEGGAVASADGHFSIATSSFELNQALTGIGGAISSDTAGAISASTFKDNSSLNAGGGLYIGTDGDVTVTNSTFHGNISEGDGGAISVDGQLDIVNGTLNGNTSADPGGGLSVFSGAATVLNTLIAGNSAPDDPDDPDVTGDATSNGHNLIGDIGTATCFTDGVNGDKVGGGANPALDPKLDILKDNGGPTQTMALLVGSPAIGAGDNAVTGAPYNLDTDQRGTGFPRKIHTNIDIGAYEDHSNLLPAGTAQLLVLARDTPKTISLAGTDSDGDPLSFKITTVPANGSLYVGLDTSGHLITPAEAATKYALPGNKVTFMPNAGYTGSTSFDFLPNDGFVDGISAKVKLKVTTTPPTASVTTPANNAAIAPHGLTAIRGTATDNSGTGIRKVTLSLYYFYYPGAVVQFWNNGSWGAYNSTTSLLPVTLGTPTGNVTPWTTTATLPTSLPVGPYFLRLEVTDNAGVSSGYLKSTFNVPSPPMGAITTPANNVVLAPADLTSIVGSATDNNGTGIRRVQLSLYYYVGGTPQFWNNGSWGAYNSTTSLLPVTLDTPTGNVMPWHTTATLPTSLPVGKFTLRFEVIDNVPLTSGFLYSYFTVKQPASLSAAGAKAFTHTIKLYFTGPLDPTTAQDISNYTVTVGGTPVTVQSATYSSSVVTLDVPMHSYAVGDTVHVAWSGIQDSNGNTISGNTDITAR